MKRVLIFITLIAIFWLAVLPVSAQEGTLIVENDSDEAIEMGELMPAAQPLVDRGATVAIYFVQKGERDEFNKRLRDDGLMQGDLLLDSLIAIFVSLDDRYSEIAFGDNFTTALNPRAEGIKSRALDGNLREGVYMLAFTRTLEDIESVIGNPSVAPPNSGTTPISYPAYTSQPDQSAGTMLMLVCVVGFVVLMVVLSKLFPEWFPANSSGTYNSSGPRYKSSWSSGSSHRSSGSSGRSFGGGGRSGGKW